MPQFTVIHWHYCDGNAPWDEFVQHGARTIYVDHDHCIVLLVSEYRIPDLKHSTVISRGEIPKNCWCMPDSVRLETKSTHSIKD
jgi:hypothetical protein